MNFSDYSKISLQRESLRVEEVSKTMSEKRNQRLLHAFIGIQTEASELLEAYMKVSNDTILLDRINALEEIGDIAFYLNIAIDVFGKKWADVGSGGKDNGVDQLKLTQYTVIQASELMDIIKRQLFYGTELNELKAISGLKDIYRGLGTMIKGLNSTWEEVLDMNNRKLELRTGKKFNADTVINRDTDKEREILEE